MKSIFRHAAIAVFACVMAGSAVAQPAGPQPDPLAPLDEANAGALPERLPTEEEIAAAQAAFEESLEHRKGVIALPAAKVTLTIPEGFYFLGAEDTRRVLEEAWANPPGTAAEGMLLREGTTPFTENSWVVVLSYEDTGYVSDEDASHIDYDMLIDAMREGLDLENRTRTEQGYPTIDIIGWATQPRYDGATHKLYWAKELSFDKSPEHTLNYDMRVLGRHGVLSLNFVASLEQLADVEKAAPAVLAIPQFDAGAGYRDFNAATDRKADFGIAGLIGGATAATLLAKNGGLIAVVLAFAKKAWVLIIIGIGAILTFVRNMLGGRSKVKKTEGQRSATAFFDGPTPEEAPPVAPADGQPPAS